MRPVLFCVAAALLVQGAAQAQFIPANPISPYPLITPQINRDGVINLTNPYVTNPAMRTFPQAGMTLVTVAPASLLNTRVTLELDNVPLWDAVTKLFDQVSEDCAVELDRDTPRDIRITLRVKNIKLATALNCITEQANLIWNPSLRLTGFNGLSKSVFRLSRAPQESKEPSATTLYDKTGWNTPLLWQPNQWFYDFSTWNQWNDSSLNKLNWHWNMDGYNNSFQYQPNINWSVPPIFYNSNGTENLLSLYYNLAPDAAGAQDGNKTDLPLYDSSVHRDTKPGTPQLRRDPIYSTSPRLQLHYTPQKSLKIQTDPLYSIPLQIDGSIKAPLHLQLERSKSLPLKLTYDKSSVPLNLQLDRSTSLLYKVTGTEEHATFTCPHCKKQITILRPKQDAHSSQRNPISHNDWKFCPHCGKPVQ